MFVKEEAISSTDIKKEEDNPTPEIQEPDGSNFTLEDKSQDVINTNIINENQTYESETILKNDQTDSNDSQNHRNIDEEIIKTNENGEEIFEEEKHVNDPLIPAQSPINLDEPIGIEKNASERLIDFLQQNDCYEPPEREQKRCDVLIELQAICNEFVLQAAINNGIEKIEIDGKPVQCLLCPFGSFRLGVCSINSDIDCLCITPKFITRHLFFKVLYDLLTKNEKVSSIQKVEMAYVPIITMTFDTIDIDISFAALNLDTITENIELTDNLLNTLDQKECNSINGVRTNDMILKLIPDLDNFRVLLRFIRLWSHKRAIYGNVYGYLGGVNCALLAAFVCQRYPKASPATLVLMFFNDLMDWGWPTPIYINTPNVGPLESWSVESHHDVMPIITPAYPTINSIRSASISTRHRMTEEFKHGFKMTQLVITKKRKWDKLIVESNFFSRYKYYIQIKISADNQESYKTWRGNVESKIKILAQKLEEDENIQYAVTYPQCFNKGDEGKEFAGSFFIGMVFKKPSEPNQKISIDVTPVTQNFLTFLMKQKDKTPPMLVKPILIKRQDVPLFVFPNGEKPVPKKPKGKKEKAKK